MIWFGLSIGVISVYDFDIESAEIRELKDKQGKHGESEPKKIDRIGKNFLYTGKRGYIMKLEFTYN